MTNKSRQDLKGDLARAQWTLEAVTARPQDFAAPHDMRDRIEALDRLPPLPEVARRVLELKSDPGCDAGRLAGVIELEPAIAAQIIRWANSALFGCRGEILSVKEAILKVLGFEPVFELALGLAALSPLQAPSEGLLGKRFFWQQTLAGSALMQKLAFLLTPERRAEIGQVHLLYLLHNVGHLLASHLFTAEFDYLRKLTEANAAFPLISLERYAWGVEHGQLGGWLMRAWGMPERLELVTRHHHNPYYRGRHESAVWLTCLTDRLLGTLGIGDAVGAGPEETPLYRNLGLLEADAEACLAAVADARPELDQAVARLVR